MTARLSLLLGLAAGTALAGPPRGRIVTDDGMPVPAATQVTVRCGAASLPAVEADAEGWFELPAHTDPQGCAAVVTAPGYRAARTELSTLPADPAIPAAVLYRLGKSHGESISVSHLAAPANATRNFHAAVRELQRGSRAASDTALDYLRQATKAYPDYAQAWFETGRLQLALGKTSRAMQAFQTSIRADPWFVSPYKPLILLMQASGEVSAAAEVCGELRRINPALPADCSGD